MNTTRWTLVFIAALAVVAGLFFAWPSPEVDPAAPPPERAAAVLPQALPAPAPATATGSASAPALLVQAQVAAAAGYAAAVNADNIPPATR